MLDGALLAEGGRKRAAVFERIESLAGTFNEFMENVVRNAIFEYANGNRVVSVTPKYFGDDTVGLPKELKAKSVTNDVRCKLHAPRRLHVLSV